MILKTTIVRIMKKEHFDLFVDTVNEQLKLRNISIDGKKLLEKGKVVYQDSDKEAGTKVITSIEIIKANKNDKVQGSNEI